MLTLTDPNPTTAALDTEVVYVAADGEFIRQAYADPYRSVCGGLPQRLKLVRWAGNLKALGVDRVSARVPPEVIERAFTDVFFEAQEFRRPGLTVTNALVAQALRQWGYVNPRRYPAVEFFVDPVACWPATEVSPVGKNGGNQWCHLYTTGDREDLHRFAQALGLDRSDFVDQGDRFWRYDLTPGKRRKALAFGARETDYPDIAALLRKRDEYRF